jgi:serine acetyltransferase
MGVVDGGRPRIGARVWVGADSILYGAILVGDGATVMPGSVVSRHVPPGAVVSGNPPRLLALDYDNSVWRAAHWNSGPVERFPGSA